jgi:Mn-containing catalase
VFARMLQQGDRWPRGEIRVALQYLFQGWGYRGPDKYRDMILWTATEEIGHIELLATAVSPNLVGAKSEQVDDTATNPMVAARMGALEPRHFLSGGLAAMPSDANGVPFNSASIDAGGNLIANKRANVAAEAIGRTLACRLLEMTDDPGMKDMVRFLIARDTMHQQQWLAVLEELGPEMATNAPGDFENTDEFADHAYAFMNHHLDTEIDTSARFASGPSLDGKGEFRVVEPAIAAAPQPPMQKAPPQVHPGLESTVGNGSASTAGIAARFTGLAGDIADRLTSAHLDTSDYEDMSKEDCSPRPARPTSRAARRWIGSSWWTRCEIGRPAVRDLSLGVRKVTEWRSALVPGILYCHDHRAAPARTSPNRSRPRRPRALR